MRGARHLEHRVDVGGADRVDAHGMRIATRVGRVDAALADQHDAPRLEQGRQEGKQRLGRQDRGALQLIQRHVAVDYRRQAPWGVEREHGLQRLHRE